MENTLPKSSKTFIRLEKARIRKQFFDTKKQEEMIDLLYKRMMPQVKTAKAEVKPEAVKVAKKVEPAREVKKETAKPKAKAKVKK